MGKGKIAPYYLYLLIRKGQLKAQGKIVTEEALSQLVSDEWSQMTKQQKAIYKEKAGEHNEQWRSTHQKLILPTASEPDTQSPNQRMISNVTRFLAAEVGAPRTSVMRFEFVSCCISPIFIFTQPRQTTNDGAGGGLPGESVRNQPNTQMEISLVRWNILSGIKEVYSVICNVPTVPDEALSVRRYGANLVSEQARSCSNLDIIANEIREFMGDTNVVLVRGAQEAHVSACLNIILNSNGGNGRANPIVLDNIVVLRQLLINENRNKGTVALYNELREKFDLRSGPQAARFDPELNRNTAVDCWHSNQQYCAARRAVNDAYSLLGELGPAFFARMNDGYHTPIPGKILPRKLHCCRQSICPGSGAPADLGNSDPVHELGESTEVEDEPTSNWTTEDYPRIERPSENIPINAANFAEDLVDESNARSFEELQLSELPTPPQSSVTEATIPRQRQANTSQTSRSPEMANDTMQSSEISFPQKKATSVKSSLSVAKRRFISSLRTPLQTSTTVELYQHSSIAYPVSTNISSTGCAPLTISTAVRAPRGRVAQRYVL